MTRLQFVLMLSALAALALGGMWIAWRARARRDAAETAPSAVLSGEVIEEFPRASYVSTTPVGAPFERVAVPGLRYKGYAEVRVLSDGVSIAVTGEPGVCIAASQLTGSGTAGGRIGKVVERDGLSLLRWTPAPGAAGSGAVGARELESSFRLADPAEQRRFSRAIDALTGAQILTGPDRGAEGSAVSEAGTTMNSTHTTQEDA